MSVRLRRLEADHDAIKRLAAQHPRIEVEGASGNPPDRYRIVFLVRSVQERGGAVVPAMRHVLEVVLPQGYPRDAPLCRMLTPVFHPNIAPHAVCIGDHWTAGEALDLMIQRVGEMLAFQSYNLKSPLNGRAARWVEENLDMLPTDREEFFRDVAHAPEAASAGTPCTNCGATGVPLARCPAGHQPCRDCVITCERCGGHVCLACGRGSCVRCSAQGQPPGGPATPPGAPRPVSCVNCGASGRAPRCAGGHALCGDCEMDCRRCGVAICLACGETACRACG